MSRAPLVSGVFAPSVFAAVVPASELPGEEKQSAECAVPEGRGCKLKDPNKPCPAQTLCTLNVNADGFAECACQSA